MSKTKTYANLEIFEDGCVAIYRRTAGQKPTYQTRIRVPGVAGYIIKSTNTTKRDEAYRFAMSLFDELRLKVLAGESIKSKSASSVIDEYLNHIANENHPRHQTRNIIGNHLRKYTRKNTIDFLDSKSVSEYFTWRTDEVRKKVVRKVSSNTLHTEAGEIGRFLRWCFERKFIRELPQYSKPKRKDNRRPAFDERDWRKLTRHAREWIKKSSNPAHVRDKIMLWNFVLILSNTGMRVGEARSLRWRDINPVFSEGRDKPDWLFSVKGKTGAREVVARTNEVWTYLERIIELRKRELVSKLDLNSFVFCHPDGKQILSFKKSFASLIKSAGVETDSDGNRRTLYSLRHTYATFRLHEGVNHYMLAQNMGTSVAMIERFYGHTSNVAQVRELTKSSPKGKRPPSVLDFMSSSK